MNELLLRARSGNSFEAMYATVGLGEIGDAAIPVIHDIAALMKSNEPVVRREAALALAKLGPRSAPVLEELAFQVAKNPSDDASWFAAKAIGKIGKPALKYVPLLKSRLGTGAVQFDDSLRRAIANLEVLQEAEQHQSEIDVNQ